MSRLTWFLEGVSHYVTMWIGVHYGERFPMHFVCGYPRSGTTWFSELLADYLNLPRPRHYLLPLAFGCVVHTHVPPRHRLDDCFYVVRDGRDALVSGYFKLIKILKEDDGFVYRNRYLELFSHDLEDTSSNLIAYTRSQFEREKAHWGTHVVGWMRKAQENPEDIVIVKYEDLLEDTVEAFSRVLRAKYGDANLEFVRSAVDRQRFDRQRRRSADQHRTFLRKGQSGDWRDWFTSECAEVFNAYAGEALIEAGYEQDHEWVAMEQCDSRD